MWDKFLQCSRKASLTMWICRVRERERYKETGWMAALLTEISNTKREHILEED